MGRGHELVGGELEAYAYDLATWRKGSTLRYAVSDLAWYIGGYPLFCPTSDRLRVYAGQPDPADASAFSFEFESQGPEDPAPLRYTVRGTLTNDGVSLKLEPRQSP